MIQANELRIGNWVSVGVDKWPIQVDRIGKDGIKHLHPIPLTPEILEKAGFEPEPEYKGSFVIKLSGSRQLRVAFPEVFVSMGLSGQAWDDDRFRHIKHVHTLQNFFYSYTGTELNINL